MRKDVDLLFLFLFLSLPLNVLTYPFILGNTRTNGLVTSSKYPIKYLELFFVSTNFLHHKFLILLLLPYQISTVLYY